MAAFQFREIAKHAWLRAFLLGVMGAISILLPQSLTNGIIYAIAAYAILNGALGLMDLVAGKSNEVKGITYLNAIAAGLSVLVGVLSILYFRYVVSFLPVFLGALLVVEGIVYLGTALCIESKWKPLLVILALLTVLGGFAMMVFAFGFGGLITLSRMLGAFLLLSCVCELLIRCMGKALPREAAH